MLRDLAELTILDEGDPQSFRVRAYESAASGIAAWGGDIERATLKELQTIEGVGKSTAEKIRELCDTGKVEKLEGLANSMDGVEQSYAIQAGRELRILVNNEKISDDAAKELAKSIAKRIESELKYPGRIKVTIIREMRVIEYAR